MSAQKYFDDLDDLLKDAAENQNDYDRMLTQFPAPWSDTVKAKFRTQLHILRGNVHSWNELIEKLHNIRKRMSNDDADEKDAFYEKIRDFSGNQVHKSLIKKITKAIHEGEYLMNLSVPPPANPVNQNQSPPRLSLTLSTMNLQKYNGDYLGWNAFWQRFNLNIHSQPFSKIEKLDALFGLLEGKALDEVKGFIISEENYDTVIQILTERFGNKLFILNKIQCELQTIPAATENYNSIRDTLTTPNISTDMILKKMKEIEVKAEVSLQVRSRAKINNMSSNTSAPNLNHPTPSQNFQKSNKKFVCSLCDENHYSSNCPKFITTAEKFNQLKLKNRCTKCAGHNHLAQNCNTPVKCTICNGHHYAFLCKSKDNGNFQKANDSKAFISVGAKHGFLLTKKVTVMHPETQKAYEAIIFFDCGSQRSYVSNKLISQLKLRQFNQGYLNVQGIGAKATNYKSTLTKIRIKTTENFTDIYANSIPQIATKISLIESDIMDKFQVDDLKIRNETPDILIGMDYFCHFILPFDKKGEYCIVNSIVGKMLSGKIPQKQNVTVSALAIEQKPLYNPDDDLQNLWKLEAMGIKEEDVDEAETEVLEKFKESIKFKDNRFSVSWPTKSKHKQLPTNAGLSIGRLNSTLKKLSEAPHLFKEYQDIFDKQYEQGKIEIALKKPQGGLVHYLPHHAVITPHKSTTKVRMVFDGSAKCTKDAPSLNDCFIRGPLKVPDICCMLLRIRTCKYLLMGDIEKAFHQVYLNEEDRDAVRFFWVKDPSKPASGDNLIVYRFVAVPFGIISSPFILWIIILILLQKLENAQLRQMIAENTYVDNIFLMVDDEAEGIKYFKETRQHFSTASMNVREWLSNSKTINEAFPNEIKQPYPIAKILGIQWNSQDDTLSIELKNAKEFQTWTKRSVLKFIASTFDPLGFLSPFTMKGKLFIQKLFKLGIPWDIPLETELLNEWQKIIQDWDGKIIIPRKLVHETMPKSDLIEIHAFGDASKTAYCACVYLRIKTSTGYITILVFAKTKLQPLNKDLTIPKMEIMAMWLAAKIASFVAKQLKLEASKKFVWTDSQISFYWFNKWPKDIFVSNRLKLILASNVDVLFVPGKLNPADLGTRGILFEELKKATFWWHGPKFLQQDEALWPKIPQLGSDLTQTVIALVASNANENTITMQNVELRREFNIDSNLSWTNFLKKITLEFKCDTNEEDLTANDLKQVKNMLIAQEQQIYITPQIENHLKLAKNEDGVYCIHTRFDNAELINPTPVYLPQKSPITKMIVMDIHEKLNHSGTPHTLSKVRENYWIPSGRLAVQKIIQKCKSCKIWKGKPFALPNMPQLPSTRINKSKPFENTGIDYCGPFKIKGAKEKSWIMVLFPNSPPPSKIF
uniref:Uncharacterized protein n=1 Tax=Panagrolaimus davidi TaxID=227884 RepID=A0A914PK88_9BILA